MFSFKKPRLAVVQAPAPSLAEQALVYLDDLYGLARYLTQSTTDAEDLVQDTYSRALAGAARFQPGGNLRAWLLRIMRNCFIDGTRRRKVVLEIPDDNIEERDELWDNSSLDRLRFLTAADIETAMAALPVEMRFIVVLDTLGCSEIEIAEIARCAPGTVKSRLSRARGRLRVALEEHRP
jgi:RNA polymerase sigma-70 factor, ECF subfamily